MPALLRTCEAERWVIGGVPGYRARLRRLLAKLPDDWPTRADDDLRYRMAARLRRALEVSKATVAHSKALRRELKRRFRRNAPAASRVLGWMMKTGLIALAWQSLRVGVRSPKRALVCEAAIAAVATGTVWETDDYFVILRVCREAAMRGDIPMLEALTARYGRADTVGSILKGAAKHGHAAVIEWVAPTFDQHARSLTAAGFDAIRQGHIAAFAAIARVPGIIDYDGAKHVWMQGIVVCDNRAAFAELSKLVPRAELAEWLAIGASNAPSAPRTDFLEAHGVRLSGEDLDQAVVLGHYEWALGAEADAEPDVYSPIDRLASAMMNTTRIAAFEWIVRRYPVAARNRSRASAATDNANAAGNLVGLRWLLRRGWQPPKKWYPAGRSRGSPQSPTMRYLRLARIGKGERFAAFDP